MLSDIRIKIITEDGSNVFIEKKENKSYITFEGCEKSYKLISCSQIAIGLGIHGIYMHRKKQYEFNITSPIAEVIVT